MALFRAPVSGASQPANRYAERTTRYTAGAPGLEQIRRPATKSYTVVAVPTSHTNVNHDMYYIRWLNASKDLQNKLKY
jgi:hypothetical protein